jgi:peptidyl-prolyl cis-trans isomerase B (cyclophilin B)
VAAEKSVDLKQLFPSVVTPGTYLLYATPQGGGAGEFDGTPLVISVRQDRRRNAPPGAMVIKVEPLRYAVMTTDRGTMTLAFYYDAAPHTVANFLSLADGGFYDGLTFHRIVPEFVLQGGDPRGDGTGGPGYSLDAEFNDRPHEPGVLSMARVADPLETQPPFAPPRPEYANSAGSQFMVCLNYANTKALDGKYTAFGRVVAGMETVTALAGTPVADAQLGTPGTPPVIQKVEVKPVTSAENPYANLRAKAEPATQPVE